MNAEQLAVIRHDQGPLQVLAQAGSGKTRAAVHRVARLVNQGTDPSRILMVTFSKKAADEMDKRVRHLGVTGCSCQTWHSFALRVIREDGLPQATWEVDEKDRAKQLVKQAAGYRHVNWMGANLTRIRKFIGHCKANAWEPSCAGAGDLAKELFGWQSQKAARVYQVSQLLIEEAHLLTFDDMLVWVARHFGANEEARASWAGRFDQVITDEAQDNSLVQVQLQRALSKDHRNLMVVGDLAQAIYSFRGSSPAYLADFPREWSDVTRVAMCSNYRSGSRIIDVANEVIRPAEYRQPEDMVAARDDGAFPGTVEVVRAHMLEDEAGEVVSRVLAEREGGRPLGDICVLFRLNAQSRALEEALLRANLPYQIVGGTNFYERKEVKDLLAYLRVATGRDPDGDAVRRCINAPFRFLGARFVERVMRAVPDQFTGSEAASWANRVLRAASAEGIQQRQMVSAQEWADLIGWLESCLAGQTSDGFGALPNPLLDELVRRTCYLQWLEKEEGEESIENSHAANVRELVRVASNFPTVAALLDYVDANIQDAAKNRRRRKSEDQLTLMTIHRSKGLEWPVCWVVGCNEEVLPHAKGDPEEERRLMYVAVTRARDALVCSYVEEMATKVGIRQMEPSRFLQAFPGTRVPEEPPCEVVVSSFPKAAVELVMGTAESCYYHGPFAGEECPECIAHRRKVLGV